MAPLARPQPLLFPLPERDVGRPRRHTKVYKATLDDEYARLLDAAPSQDYRDLFTLMRWAGLRVSEACGLEWANIDFEVMQMRIVGKGNVVRDVDILPEAETMLRRRRLQVEGPALYIFPGESRQGSVSPRAVQKVMKRLRERLGIPRERCTPHKLRHSFATNALQDGAPLQVVSAQLGHASVSTTSIYLHSRPGQLRRVYDKG